MTMTQPTPQSPQTSTTPRYIGSETMRRRTAMVRWALLGSLCFVINLLLAQVAVGQGWFTYVFSHTVTYSYLAYGFAFWLIDRTLFMPSVEGNGTVLVATLFAFLVLVLGFAALQIPYSRAAVLLSYATTSLWFAWGYHRHVRGYSLKLGFVEDAALARFHRAVGLSEAASLAAPHALRAELVVLSTQHPAESCDGVVLDRYAHELDADDANNFGAARTRQLADLALHHIRIYRLEKVVEMLTGRVAVTHIDDNFIDLDGHPFYEMVKRTMDITLVLLAAPLVLPLCAVMALWIRLDSPGTALYSQWRVGRDGVPFRIWKFRSMVPEGAAAPARFASSDDPRITRLGKRLRKFRIDELPQLWNVLRGDMSLIGPRPEQVSMAEDFATQIPYYPYRHLVRPGLSGWAQVQQGYADDADSTVVKLSYDLYYVKHLSLALDLLIVVKTIRTILTGFGAR